MFNKKLPYKIKKRNKGFSLVELVVALGIFAIVSSGVIFVVINSYRTYYGAGDRQVVVQFAQEGLEAVKSIRDNSWQGVVAVADDNDHGVIKTNGLWQFSGTSNTLGALTRTIVISNVSRDNSGNIDAGTAYDPNTKKVIVTVSGAGISNYVLVSFITNWSHRYWEQTDWSGIGTSEFWNSAVKASSSYSNISTATPGALTLALSAGGTPGSYGDWGDVYPIATTTYFTNQIHGMALSPDQRTLYTTGSDTAQSFRAYDVSQARAGIIKELWSIKYNTDVLLVNAATVTVHPNGRYVYVGCYASTGTTGRLILIIDTWTREYTFSTGGTAGGSSMYINDIVVDSANGYVYGLGRNFRIFPFQITNNGGTLTLVGSSSGQIMADGSLNRGIIENGWLYIVTSDGPKSFQKINISNPAALTTTTGGGYVFANPNGARPRYNLKYIETVTGLPRFLVTNYSGSYEVEIIRDDGTSATTIGNLGLTNSLYFDIADGGLGARTYWVYSYTGDLQELYIDSNGAPSISGSVCNGRTCKYGNYYNNVVSNSSFWADNMVYSSVLGGLILLEYQGAIPTTYSMYFVPKNETRANGATYSYRRSITIDHTKVSTQDQTSFPVLISGTYSYLKTISNGGDVQSAYGDDVIFTSDIDGTTILDHEVESYSSSTGALTAWVRIPTLSSSVDTTIYMFYGNNTITSSQERANAVWDTNFKFVSHMAGNGTDSVRNDSTSDNNSLYKYWGDPSTFDVAVSASSDDAQELVSNGTVTTNADPLHMSYNSGTYYTGLRFQNVQVPQGAKIINAYLEFQAGSQSGVNGDAINNVIAAEATDDAATFAATNYNISSRATTTNFVTWSWAAAWTAGTLYRTNDISQVVREVVNRPGWTSGNDMAFRIAPDPTQTSKKIAKSYDNASWTSTTSPRLYINYASSTSGQINSGDYFDNDQDRLLSFYNYKSLWQNTSDFTAEFWIKYTSMLSYSYSCVLYKGNGDAGTQEGWLIRLQNLAGQQKLTFHMGNSGVNLQGKTMNNALSPGTWTHVAMVVDRDVGYQWYLNGVAEASYAINTSAYTVGTSTALGISWDWSTSSTTMSLGVHLDEVRISNATRTPGWLVTSFNSQNDPSSFYSVSGATTVAGYASPGVLYSSIIDLGASDQTLASISVDQNIPSGCSLVATLEGSDASDFSSITSADFSDSASFYTSSTPSSLDNKRYLRYKVTLNNCNSGSSAPTLYSLRLNYR